MAPSFIKGSGLAAGMAKSDLSAMGASSIVDVNDLKRTGYCIQGCLFNKLLKETHRKSGSELSILA